MTRYRAAILPAPHQPVEFREFPAPELEPGAGLLQTLYSEVCGTDVHLRHGKLAGVPYPIIPGHVSVGAVSAMRTSLRDIEGRPVREGDIVTFLDVHETCHACWYCLVGKQSTRCPHRKVYGITYGVADGLLGGWSEAIWLKPGVKLVPIPRDLDPETFIGGGCGLTTALHAIDLAQIQLDQSVAVLGAGPVGQSVTALAALSGAGEIVTIGGPEDRLVFARRMGATTVIGLDLPPEERASQVHRLTGGRGADVVIEASGAPEAVTQALDMVRDGGRVVVVGQYTDHGTIPLNPHLQINRKHVTMRGCWGSDFSHFHRAVGIATRHGGRFPWRELAGRRYPLAEAEHALDAVERREVVKAVIAVHPSVAATIRTP
ncbi:MAG: zinc-binding dehydrogenase [Gemmatimonadota bacterium]|nr:zinc-binding dehydrogenase [Gemmatimonadota bacterium]